MPATVISEHATGPGRAIGLFLARLLASLLRLRASGEANFPPYIAQMVGAADDMVRAYICNLAAVRLKSAGYAHAARVLRATRADRPDTAPLAHIEPASLDDLTARLEDTITLFQQAESMSEHFARLVFCALCMTTTDERGPIFPLTATCTTRRAAASWSLAHQFGAMAGRGPPYDQQTPPMVGYVPDILVCFRDAKAPHEAGSRLLRF